MPGVERLEEGSWAGNTHHVTSLTTVQESRGLHKVTRELKFPPVVALPWVALAGKRRWGAAAGIQKDWEKDLESVDLHLVRRLVRHLHLHLHPACLPGPRGEER